MLHALRERGSLALRLLVSAVLLIIVLAYADVGEVAKAARDNAWGWLVGALALMALASVVGAIRWRLLLQGAHIQVSILQAVRAFAASLLLNNVLPTSVGGDAVRAWLVGRQSGRFLGATASTIVDKATALGCLFVLGWVALAVERGAVPRSIVGVFAWVTIGLAAALGAATLVVVGARPVIHRLPKGSVALIEEAWATLRGWASSGKLVASLLGLGIAYQALAVLALILTGKSIGLEISFALAAVSASIVLVAMLIPVSIGGLGVREGGFVLLLGEAGFSAAEATLLALLSAATIVVAGAVVVAVTGASDALLRRESNARSWSRQPSG